MRRLQHTITSSEVQAARGRTRERPVGAKGGPELTASKEMGISVLPLNELDFSNNLNELECGLFPEPTDANTLILAL